MTWLRDYVSQIAAFIILISVVNMIMPKGGTAKAARLVLSAALLCVMVTPVAKIFSFMKGDNAALFSLNNAQLKYDQAAISQEARFYEENQKAAVLEAYRESLSLQMGGVVEADAYVKQEGYYLEGAYFAVDDGDESFGRVKYIRLILARKPRDTQAAPKQPIIKIEQPSIKVNIFGDGNVNESAQEVEADTFVSLKKLVSNFYGVDEGNIFIETGD